MIAKVTVPFGMNPEMYWNNVIVLFANDKLCATRANFKMNLLKRYKGMCVQFLLIILHVYVDVRNQFILWYISVDWEADNMFNRDDTKLVVEFCSEFSDSESKTYEDCEELMRFIDGYAVHNVGTRELYKYLKAKPGNTLLDCLTVYNIA